ncbi:mannosyl transferase, putative [Bodo saltans]|uniref:Mannosyltransferase n=1 Tax=Bodo saltans TaxID=75058 RepID=A0A0S4ITY5_BODSA|nr:mannosyl transferase, putative [Bodo saltans]|eukprot:CUF82723.1 mannosyl transferase, putative [Bodo saltans]
MQTWEYSNQYALRSYAYLWLYAGPAKAILAGLQWLASSHPELSSIGGYSIVDDEAMLVYFGYRFVTAVASVICELYFVGALPRLFRFCRQPREDQQAAWKVKSVAVLLLICAAPSVGHASFSTLPTSFCMSLYFAALGGWIRLASPSTSFAHSTSTWSHRPALVVLCVCIVVIVGIVGWPFALLLAVPMALHFALKAISWSLIGVLVAAVVCGGVFVFDGSYFCTPYLCAACNIVKYNVFGAEGRGPELYGVEPWDYFLKNLLLQWNILFVMGAAVFPCIALRSMLASLWRGGRQKKGPSAAHVSSCSVSTADMASLAWYCSGFFVWFALWTRIPHKEERFMVPAYPFLFLAALSSLVVLWQHSPSPSPWLKRLGNVRQVGIVAVVLLFGVCSYGRTMAMMTFYGQPQKMWQDPAIRRLTASSVRGPSAAVPGLSSSASPMHRVVVCVGKEWYRFPTHFFLPHNSHNTSSGASTYAFLRTKSFSGALPKPFSSTEGSCAARSDMNDLNQENAGQFVEDMNSCDFVWDSVAEHTLSSSAQQTADENGWVWDSFTDNIGPASGDASAFRLLDPVNTPLLCRALHFPFLPYYQTCAKWHHLTLRTRRLT